MVDSKAITLEEEADTLLMEVEDLDVATIVAGAEKEVQVQMIPNIVVAVIALVEVVDQGWQIKKLDTNRKA